MDAIERLRKTQWKDLSNLDRFIAVAREEPFYRDSPNLYNENCSYLAAEELAALRSRLAEAEAILADIDNCLDSEGHGPDGCESRTAYLAYKSKH